MSQKYMGVFFAMLLLPLFVLKGADGPGAPGFPPAPNGESVVPGLDSGGLDSNGLDSDGLNPNGSDSTGALATAPPNEPGVKWRSLLFQSGRFLLLENGFRYATEPATRHPGLPYFRGYLMAVGNLHGWADGDPFYVNYVGHAMQGAVSGLIWIHNDRRYAKTEFGRDPLYWKGRLRAGAFAWAYSEWTEIGPFMSEAAIGNIQAFHPQQGFVDHIATPSIGLGWIIAEDAMDRYVVEVVERKTTNPYVRILVRSAANPSRSLANVLGGQFPWARERDHGGPQISSLTNTKSPADTDREPGKSVAPFEFAANTFFYPSSAGRCVGGGATAAFRVASTLQMVLDVNGCKMMALSTNLSGDSLSYMVGPRWTPYPDRRLVPYVQMLVGGNKETQELMFPDLNTVAVEAAADDHGPGWVHAQFTKQFEASGFAMAAGAGIDMRLNRALSFRLGGVEYTRAWIHELNGNGSNPGLQLKMGIVLHMGNW